MKTNKLFISVIFLFNSISSYALGAVLSVQEIVNSSKVNSVLSELGEYDLLILGSEHDDEYEKFVRELTLEIKKTKPSLDCKFWEESVEFQEALSLGETNYKAFYDLFYRQSIQISKRFESVYGRGYSASQIYPAKLKPLMEAGILSIPIDESMNSFEWLQATKRTLSLDGRSREYRDNFVELFIESRNKEMSDNITDAFSSGNCAKGILSVGTLHLADEYYNGAYKVTSIKAHLEKNGFRVKTIKLVE